MQQYLNFNVMIGLILIYALVSGTSFNDYKFKLRELPWLISVIVGFTVSLLGLFYYNDERIIFLGCAVLLIAKIITWYQTRTNQQ